MQIERLRDGLLNDLAVGAIPLVGLHEGVGPPVGPVHMVPKHGDGERVGQVVVAVEDDAMVGAVVLDSVDGVGPESEERGWKFVSGWSSQEDDND